MQFRSIVLPLTTRSVTARGSYAESAASPSDSAAPVAPAGADHGGVVQIDFGTSFPCQDARHFSKRRGDACRALLEAAAAAAG